MIMTILTHTPFWVWGLLAALMTLGGLQLRPRALAPARITMVPLLVMAASLISLSRGFDQPWTAFAVWICAVGSMVTGARAALAIRGATYDASTRRVLVPGSAVPLVLILVLFTTRYVAAVCMATQPGLAGHAVFVATLSAVYGACSGIFVARALSLRKLLLRAATSAVPSKACA